MGNDEPVTPVFPNSDFCTGTSGVIAVLNAILRRGAEGGSYTVDVSPLVPKSSRIILTLLDRVELLLSMACQQRRRISRRNMARRMDPQWEASLSAFPQYALHSSPLPTNAERKLRKDAIRSRLLREEAFWCARNGHYDSKADHSFPGREGEVGV